MAFGFFRRRQKMVIIIMVALMISFLVGSYGFNMIFSPNPHKREIGQTRAGEVRMGDLWAAEAEIEILRTLGFGNRNRYQPWPTEMAFMYLQANDQANREDSRFAYTLLQAEARAAGVQVTEGDVSAFFAGIGATGDRYDEKMSSMRSIKAVWTEKAVRGAIANWLRVHKYFVDSSVACPPSEREVQLAYRDLNEQIDLRVLRVKADDHLKDVPDPNQADIDSHFNLYRTRFEGQTRKVDDLGFGYRQPGRARIQYLYIRGDATRRVTEPDFRDVMDYYNDNKSRFVKDVPASGPATRPAGAASQPAETPRKTAQKTFAEAKAEIIEELRGGAVRDRLDDLAARAESALKRVPSDDVKAGKAYDKAVEMMKRPADKALAVVLPNVKISNLALNEAVDRLAEAAKLAGICYPWGTHGENTLDPSVKVTIQSDRITLGEALAEIGKQAKWPKLHWAMCEGVRDVLFSVAVGGEGVDFFPFQAGRTTLDTGKEIMADKVLGNAYASPEGKGNTVVQIAFTAKGLSNVPSRTPIIKVGEQGSRMYVSGDRTGRVLWRLAEVSSEHVPERLDDRPGLREQVVKDLKLKKAFELALDMGNKAKAASAQVGLEKVAQFQKIETFTTGLFARRSFARGYSMIPRVLPTDVPNLDLDTYELRAAVIGQAFKMVPKNVEPTVHDGPRELTVIPLKIRKEVLVVERVGYKPLVRPEYEGMGRLQMAWFVASRRRESIDIDWFALRTIQKRVGWKSTAQREDPEPSDA
jgi:hypothetical protein